MPLCSARLLIATVAASSFMALAPGRADACSDISAAALAIASSGTAVGSGAPLFTLAQKNAFGYDNDAIVTLWSSTSPSSPAYYNFILSGHYFTRLYNIGDLAAGDVLSINAAGTYSGHTVIITGAAIAISALSPLQTNTNQWAVPIVDSTTSPHGCNASYPDSRWSGACPVTNSSTPSVGTGYIRLYSDLGGGLQGHTWSVASGGTYYSQATRPYAVGRLTPCPPLGMASQLPPGG